MQIRSLPGSTPTEDALLSDLCVGGREGVQPNLPPAFAIDIAGLMRSFGEDVVLKGVDQGRTAWSGNGQTGTYSKDHGYVFEVFADGRTRPAPIKAFGRYAHEALAVDPKRRRVYLSEDASNPNGLFYR